MCPSARIGQAFDSSQVTLNLIAVGYSLGLAASVLYLGALGDRYGRKMVLGLGTALAIPMSLLAAYAPSDEVLFVGSRSGRRSAVRSLLSAPRGRCPPSALLVGIRLPRHAAAGRRRAGAGVPLRAEPRERDERPGGQPRGDPVRPARRPLILAINFAPVPNEGALVLGLAAIALAALVAFFVRQRRAANPLYDLGVASRRVFWVAAAAGIIVFGSLMAAAFVSQQYLQNVLSYSTLEAGAAILPAALVMVLVAPRSAQLVEARGARFTLLFGYVFLLLAFLWMLLIWDGGRRTGRSPSRTSSSAPGWGLPGHPRHIR